jgi:collagen type I/II/III/V/XI/XXIV/XXVII alpha
VSTTDKDFKVKNGLIVEGSSATVNGNQVLTTASSIDSLQDVNTSGVQNTNVLSYLNGVWIPVSDTGLQGTTGAQGISGAQGTTGTTGLQGTTGTQGTTGNTGSQGTTGSSGTQGTTGLQGSTGLQGLIGLQGIIGSQGITGTQGIQGIIGDDGFVAQTEPPANTGLLWLDTDEPAVVGVEQIVAGTNVTISPTGGTGIVTINSTGGGGGGPTDDDQNILANQIFG